MNKKILCVDDDPNILAGFRRALRKDFDIHTAEGGDEGIATVLKNAPFAVVVSDMRMPGMNGVQFLARVKEIAPDSVRVMLTGNSDQQTAMNAVNEGSIFRFLTKPCPPETLAKTLDAAIEQYRLVTAEKELLEKTLNNSLQVLVDVLAMVNPTAFSRSTRVKRLARDIAVRVGATNVWEIEIAAMLSQIGCVTVPEETLTKISMGMPLKEDELRMYHKYPEIGRDLIARIPRLEIIAEIVAFQNKRQSDLVAAASGQNVSETAIDGARILKLALDYDKLIGTGNAPYEAFAALSKRNDWYDSTVLNALEIIVAELIEEAYNTEKIKVSRLEPGMILDETLVTANGSKLLAQGQEITLSLVLRLKNFAEAGIIPGEIQVKAPIKTAFSANN